MRRRLPAGRAGGQGDGGAGRRLSSGPAIRPLPRLQAGRDAVAADALAQDLTHAGHHEDARAVRLLQAEALLESGDLHAAEAAAAVAAALGAGRTGESGGNGCR